ncbi:MAG: ATP-binding protein [Allorhizobium sp.]
MAAAQYPFIDVAVHESVRERFARGEALVLFSADLANVLWANGAGARFFGNASIYDFLDQGPDRGDVSFRQVEATARQLGRVGDSRSLLLRLASGFQRVPVQATAEMVEVRRGEPVVLLAIPSTGKQPGLDECAHEMLTGLDDPDTHMAVLDADGNVVVASEAFAELKITQNTARTLVHLVGADPDRLVKRPIPTGRGYLPAAIGKLSDEPALHLLFAVETILGNMDPSDEFETEVPVTAAPIVETATQDRSTTGNYGAVVEAISGIEEFDTTPEDLEFRGGATEGLPAEPDEEAVGAVVAPVPLSEEPSARARETGSDLSEEAVVSDADEAASEDTLPTIADTSDTTAVPMETLPAEVPFAPQAFAFERGRRASRFVWKIDAEGRFSEVSGEFADAVGPLSADINGRAFADLANEFNLDPEGKISELLKRRDTWSGKTVYWPVQGTTLMVPVDLAALPTYTRNRDFDGFRGFGIVRLADAVEDPARTGLSFGASTQPAADEIEDEAGSVQSDSEAPADAADTGSLDFLEATDTDETPRLPNGEPPALQIVQTPDRRHSDKVVQLEERRARGKDGLTPVEQAAFREIARRLAPNGLRNGNTDVTTRADTGETVREPASSQTVSTTEQAAGTATPPVAGDDRAAPFEQAPEPASELPGETFIPPRSRRDIGLSPEIVDLMPVALLVHVGDRLIHGNPEFLNLTGYASLEDLEDAGGLDALLERQDLESASGHAGRMVVVRADDELVPVTARLQSVRWEQSSALLLALIPAEAPVRSERPAAKLTVLETPPKAADEIANLKAEMEELRSILETATDGVVILGADGDIRSMNRAASALFNFDDEETRGKPFVMLFAHESQKAVLDYLAGLSGHGVASVLNDGREVIGREASGGFLPLFMTIGKLTSSNGYCAVIRDITQWKRTEDELRSAKRAAETANTHKSDFLARVSHEIRTPLNAIIGFADMMAGERFGPLGHHRYAEYANDIVRSGRHVLDIVNDLLDISKIEAGEMDLEFESVGLNEAVSSAVSLVQPQANGQRVIIRTALSQSVPNVVADLRSIKQIVLNILANAIRFTPSGGQIIVSTAYESNGSVVLRIRDTGIGMSRTELELAMKPFRQVAPGARGRGDGTGLGLPLTKAMVDANRATFSIHSTPNEGTLVEITFPSPRVLAD